MACLFELAVAKKNINIQCASLTDMTLELVHALRIYFFTRKATDWYLEHPWGDFEEQRILEVVMSWF